MSERSPSAQPPSSPRRARPAQEPPADAGAPGARPTPAGHEHAVWSEPHLRGSELRPDPSERSAGERPGAAPDPDDRVDHSVWDEPALRGMIHGEPPPGALTHARWLAQKRARTTAARTWAVTGLCALAAGPLAVLGTFVQSSAGWSTLLAVVVIGPVTEEIMKVALPLWIAERRSYLFRSRPQIALCALSSGLAFAAIENVLYLHVYVPDPSPALATWRWSVCVALHMGCALVAGLGVMRAWSRAEHPDPRRRLAAATPLLITAMIIHGAYNGLAVLLEHTPFFF